MQLETKLQVQGIQLELDNKLVEAMLNDPANNLVVKGPMIEDVKSMLKAFQACEVTLVRRSQIM